MKILEIVRNRIARVSIKAHLVVVAGLFALAMFSCQKDESNMPGQEMVELKSSAVESGVAIYFDHTIFTRGNGAPFVEEYIIENPNFSCYENFILRINNGNGKKTRVSSAEIWIDGIKILEQSDFSKNVAEISKPLSGLKPASVLEVKLNSTPGSFIDLWIEGTLLLTAPEFTQIGPVVQDSEAPALPSVSNNGISGTWYPETINTSVAGYFTFVFTPDPGQCAESATMVIEVVNKGFVADAEGNVYNTVKLGDKWWMAENLRVTKYNDGSSIGTTIPATLPVNTEAAPKYQWVYYGNESNVDKFGRLYTWFTVSDSRGLCPAGWHVPSDTEWSALVEFLDENGYGFGGTGDDIAKSLASASDWFVNEIPGNVGNDMASNNSSGFTALPGGYRLATGSFRNWYYQGSWWSSNPSSSWSLYSNSDKLIRNDINSKHAVSLRCVKD